MPVKRRAKQTGTERFVSEDKTELEEYEVIEADLREYWDEIIPPQDDLSGFDELFEPVYAGEVEDASQYGEKAEYVENRDGLVILGQESNTEMSFERLDSGEHWVYLVMGNGRDAGILNSYMSHLIGDNDWHY